MADETTSKSVSPPYGVFATFKNSLEQLAQGVPNQIDRSVFPGMAWNAQNQLMLGLRFLGLITENNKPTQMLHALAVPEEAKRKAQLDKIVRARYSDLFALDLMKTTPAELDERVVEFYNVTGDTRDKVVRFFLAALAYLDIPVSPLFGKTNGSGPRRRRPATRSRSSMATDIDDSRSEEPAAGESYSLNLKSGGVLTLSATTKFFALHPDDRTFVFGLLDQLREYERTATAGTDK